MKKFIKFLKEKSAELIGLSLFMLLIVPIIIVFAQAKKDKEQEINNYNNGKCTECGGDYVYFESVGHRSYTTYIYKCENCGHMIEIGFLN